MIYLAASKYVNLCYRTLDHEPFQTLLAESPSLIHRVNDEVEVNTEGRDNVALLIKKLLFDNTSDVNIQGCKFEPISETSIRLIVTVEETKNENEVPSRYRSVVVTTLNFETYEDKPALIQRIEISASRNLI